MIIPVHGKDFTIALLMIGAFVASITTAFSSDEAACVQKIQDAVKRLNVLYIGHHLKPLSPDTPYPNSSRYDFWRQTNIQRFWLGPDTEMECLPKNCEIIDFLRDDIVDSSPFLDHKPVPSWTIEQLTAEAKPWVVAVLGSFPVNLGKPNATFNFDERDAKRYYSGKWSIRWPRTDSQGHVFEADDLAVIMSEQYGLSGCRLNFDSSFQEYNGKTISRDEALSVARSAGKTLLSNRSLLGPAFPSGLRLGTASADLRIVNPNNIFQCKTMDQVVKSLTARLAWVVQYPLLDGGSNSPSHLIAVKVDAETKEILGGDVQ